MHPPSRRTAGAYYSVLGIKRLLTALVVKKKSGRLEAFDNRKMARAVSRAGTPYALALEIARVIKSSESLSGAGQVSSATFRRMVAGELERRGRMDIAKSYLGYKKTRPKVGRRLQHKGRIRKTTKSHAKHAALTKDSRRGRPPKW